MKTKRLFTRFTASAMAAVMLTSGMSIATNAAQIDSVSVSRKVNYSGTCGENVKWELYDDGTLCVSGSGRTADYSSFGYTPWYRLRDYITSIVVEPGIEYIGKSVFEGCTSATSAIIPDTVTEIAEDAFNFCNKIKTITIPSSVKTIGPNAFDDCYGLESLTLNEGLVSIKTSAFTGCSKLTTLTIPNSVTELAENAFYDCPAITEINVGKGVTGDGSAFHFSKCSSLEKVNVNPENPDFCSIDGVVYSKDMKTIVEVPENYDCQTFDIPSSVEIIFYDAFENTGIKNVNIPDSVTVIAAGAFIGSEIESIEINENVTTIGNNVFTICKNLSNVSLPDNMQIIPRSTFYGCTALKSITIPESVTKIDSSAFESSGLESIVIPESVEIIESSAFAYCENLTYAEVKGAKKIYGGAFKYSPKLETVIIADGIENISGYVFDSCTSLKNVEIGEGLKEIYWGTFYGCTSLENCTIPASCRWADGGVFYNCTSLKTITVLNKNMQIYSGFFSYTGDTVPTGIGYVGSTLDKYCNNYSIDFTPIEAPLMGDVDCDGIVTVSDATTLQLHIAEYFPVYDKLTRRQLAIGDANGDGEIDINDVTLIQMYVARLVESL